MEMLSDLDFTPQEYLAWEREAETKSEYVKGAVYVMSGAKVAHNRISVNLIAAVHGQLKDRPCEVFGSDMRVWVDAAESYFYPDLSGLCGEVDFTDDTRDTYENPQFIIEILSDSTESFDRGQKFLFYQEIDSLKEFVLVAQNRMVIELYRKVEGVWNYWSFQSSKDILDLQSVGCQVPLEEIY
ncbi:MAG: Uma2 family endonuclease, partial [Verrucomicrobiota bacterium]